MKIFNIQIGIITLGIFLSAVSFFSIKKFMIQEEIKEYIAYNIQLEETKPIEIPQITETITEEITEKEQIQVEEPKEVKPKEVKPKEANPKEEIPIIKEETPLPNNKIIFDGLTLDELTDKLNRNLSSNVAGTGIYFAKHAEETGMDPYLSVAIMLHETGCKWGCSKIARECNNVGGIKGKPSCNGGSYKAYETLEEGIKGYLNVVYNNYYSKGLTTPELMNPKYAASQDWSRAVNSYIKTISES